MKRNAFFSVTVMLCLGCNTQNTSPPANQATKVGTAPRAVDEAPPQDASPESAPADSNQEVTLQIKDFDGIQELIASQRGKVVVMDCWSTWCGPCIKEFPGLVKLHETYPADKLSCISLSFDYGGGKDETPEEHKENVLEFLQSQNAAFDNVIASVPAEDLYKLLGFNSAAIPAIFVYDREGHIARQFEGPDAKYTDVEKLVAELLEQP